VSNPAHVSAVLALMAAWDLQPLLHDLPRLRPALHLVAGDRDGTVPPRQAADVQRLVSGSQMHHLRGLGHLAHEERPALVHALLARLGLVPAPPAGPAPAHAPD
jgi:magnesium chelatase accessory protein